MALLLAALALSGCVSQPGPAQPPVPTTEKFSLEELAGHDNASDCWLALDGKVYNVTSFIFPHPGKDAILEGCGKDATVLFETRPMGSGTPHSQAARGLLTAYLIGELE